MAASFLLDAVASQYFHPTTPSLFLPDRPRSFDPSTVLMVDSCSTAHNNERKPSVASRVEECFSLCYRSSHLEGFERDLEALERVHFALNVDVIL